MQRGQRGKEAGQKRSPQGVVVTKGAGAPTAGQEEPVLADCLRVPLP